MNKKDLLKSVFITVASLVAGFLAISLPFNLLDELSSSQMTMVFAIEIISYTLIGLIFLTARQIEADKKKKKQEKRIKRQTEIKRLNNEWYDLAA